MKITTKAGNTGIFLFAFLVFSIPAVAQKISADLCNAVFDSVSSVMTPTRVYRRHVFTSDCDFEVAVHRGGSVLLSITRYESEEESRQAFSENSKNAYDEPRKKATLNSRLPVEFWDEIALFLSDRKFDSYLLMRKNRFVITIFSDDRKTLFQVEEVLRDAPFELHMARR